VYFRCMYPRRQQRIFTTNFNFYANQLGL